ncbi:MAG: permease [Spirochaetales bacterium]|nr:permease [Spirochaetales bacterium]
MFKIFTLLADLVTYGLFRMEEGTKAAESIHFFIEDVTKIYALVVVMIYLIALVRAGLNTERIRDYLSGKKRGVAYVLASLFGSVTPFCSCSSIPLFLGFTSARIPLGITMAFLITSPMINEVAIVLLGSLLGLKFTLIYVVTGLLAGVAGGFFIDRIGAEKYLTEIGQQAQAMGKASEEGETVTASTEKPVLTFKDRREFAGNEVKEIFGRIWKWVLIGVGLGAALHGFVPDDFVLNHLGSGQWWSVPAAVFLGIPLYSGASGIIPVIESLLAKGLPVGTAMAFMMSVVAASFPEFMMLKQVMKPRLLITFFLMLLVFFTLAGWLFNALFI